MRVLLDGSALRPPLSGIGHYTHQLIRSLARLNAADRFVVFYPWSGPVGRRAPALSFGEPNVTVARQGWGGSAVMRLRKRLRHPVRMERIVGRFDLFHAPNYTFAPSVSAKRVVTIHDLTLLRFPEWHPSERYRLMAPGIKALAEVADAILADSASTKHDIVELLSVSPDRVAVVPLAADPSFRPLRRDAVESTLRRFDLAYGEYLLFVGTIEPRKNLLRLLAAVDASNGVGPLVLAGADGWRNEEIRGRIDRLHAAGRVRYLGYVADDLRVGLMSGARAFVYPSLYEGFGLPPLEAMACGVPVLTANVSSLPEVVGDAAVLVDPCDVDALAAGMRRLWEDDRLRADLRERGLRRAAEFSWERTARLTHAVYRRVLGE